MAQPYGSMKMQNFRREVREFLSRSLTVELRAEAARQIGVFSEPSVGRKWHRILFEQGWITPTWPLEFGGIGWTPLQKYTFDQECALAEAPVISAAGLQMCGPILMQFGTPQQQVRFLPRLRSGDDYWCQGYSEPGAGSDLASLACRAVCRGDEYIVDGTKLWTTHAQYAEWMFMLARSSVGERPQHGITFLLVDMHTPGITIKPIISMSGEHEVNQVFFDGARVPVANRIGAEGDGWNVAKRLLEFERGGVYGPRVRRTLARARRLAAATEIPWCQSDFWRRFASLSIEADALEAAELQLLEGVTPASRAVSSSLLKLSGTETLQRASEICVLASGSGAAYAYDPTDDDVDVRESAIAMARYLNIRAATIYGGSSEVQRNILAKMALDL
jgi:alkylation response protein AidB-like acyl-CoA dehydrogenase